MSAAVIPTILLGGALKVLLESGFFGDEIHNLDEPMRDKNTRKTKLSRNRTQQTEYPDKVQEMEKHAQVARLLESDFWLRRVLCSKIASHPRALQSKCISSLSFVPLTSPAP